MTWRGGTILACLLTAASMAFGQPVDEVAALRAELFALRAQVAQTQLELSQTVREIEELQQFTAADAQRQIEQWRRQRAAIEAERAELSNERLKLERARQALRLGARLPDTPPPATTRTSPNQPDQPRWDVDYKIATIPSGGGESVYVDPTIGEVLLQRFPQIDRRHIMVRGTFQNRSASPYRYTFEIRLGDRFGGVIGRWRYQTPALTGNELHAFEVKVPVSDVAAISSYQIGNVEADRPQ